MELSLSLSDMLTGALDTTRLERNKLVEVIQLKFCGSTLNMLIMFLPTASVMYRSNRLRVYVILNCNVVLSKYSQHFGRIGGEIVRQFAEWKVIEVTDSLETRTLFRNVFQQ